MTPIKALQTLAFASLASAAFATLATPAFAAECPAASQGVDVRTSGPNAPSKVTDNVISSIDLTGYNVAGRQLRLRRLVVQPGGVVPWHSHQERPANIYILRGAITEYRSTCRVGITHSAGEVVAESGNLSHWWRNNTRHVTVLLSADVLPPQMAADSSM
ncbi:MAG TPA: cupin domain-containing protein [Caulobacterales bacterium]|nr:cupin domain-containing protein [Caulobacterales bacterium]